MYNFYDEKASFRDIQFLSSRLLSCELNELQSIMLGKLETFIQDSVKTGAITPINFQDLSNHLVLKNNNDLILYTKGERLFIPKDTTVNVPSLNNGEKYILFVEMWYETATKDSHITAYGKENGDKINNYIKPPYSNVETQRRTVLKWRLRAEKVENESYTNSPDFNYLGYNTSSVSNFYGKGAVKDLVKPTKGQPSNIYLPSSILAGQPNDKNLWICGDGGANSKQYLQTFDGYTYAVPLVKVSKTSNVYSYKALIDSSSIRDALNNINRMISTLAPKESPTFSGTPKAPTAQAGDSSHQLANTEFVKDALKGNAGSASKLATARTINIAGAVNGNAKFDGSSDIILNTHLNQTELPIDADLNSYVGIDKIGMYFVGGGNTCKNKPNSSVDAFCLLSVRCATGWFAQMLIANGGNIYVRFYNSSFTGWTTLYTTSYKPNKADVGLGNVTNESKATMFNNPAFTGTPTAPTPANGTNNTQIATTAFVKQAVDAKTNITGNATTADKLKTPRKINGVPFDGSADITTPNITHSKSIVINADSDSSTTTENVLIKAGGNELQVVSSGGGTSPVKNNKNLTFNGNPVYHAGNKPVKADVGLGNVDNTSDINKPISTAMQNALNSKLDKSGGTLTGNVTFSDDNELSWIRNTDYAKIRFKSTGDDDADSYMEFKTGDNGDEYFKFSQQTYNPQKSSIITELMTIKSDHLRFKGNPVYHTGNKPKLSELTNDAGFIKNTDGIGGRNYLRDTKSIKEGSKYWGKNNNPTLSLENSNIYPTNIVGISSDKAYSGLTQGIKLQAGTYTLHFKAKSKTGDATTIYYGVDVYHSKDTIAVKHGKSVNLTEKWADYSLTFNISEDISVAFVLYTGATTTTAKTFYAHSIKLEKGIVATDWTPAPEDGDEQSHTHSNKAVLDKIDQNRINAWNDGVRRVTFVGSDAENSDGWYKVASQTCSDYGNTNITFMVTSTFGNYSCGILQLQMRSDKTQISCARLSWLTRAGFDTNHFIIVINGMTWTLYVYQPCPRYGRIAFEILSLSSIDSMRPYGTLNFANNNTKEVTAPKATSVSCDSSVVRKATLDSENNQINTTYAKLTDKGISKPYRATLSSTDTFKISTGLSKSTLEDLFKVTVLFPSASSAPKLVVDNCGAVTVVKPSGSSKVVKANEICNLIYDGNRKVFQCASGGADDVSFSASDLLTGKSANNSNGEKVNGTMPNRGEYQMTGGIGFANDYMAFNNIPYGYYPQSSNGWAPEIRAKMSDVAKAIGLTADKIVKGNSILGVDGSAKKYYSESEYSSNHIVSCDLNANINNKRTFKYDGYYTNGKYIEKTVNLPYVRLSWDRRKLDVKSITVHGLLEKDSDNFYRYESIYDFTDFECLSATTYNNKGYKFEVMDFDLNGEIITAYLPIPFESVPSGYYIKPISWSVKSVLI